jgi:hypothetical protein
MSHKKFNCDVHGETERHLQDALLLRYSCKECKEAEAHYDIQVKALQHWPSDESDDEPLLEREFYDCNE